MEKTLVDSMYEHRMDKKDLKVTPIDNNDVPNFLRELNEFLEISRKSNIRVGSYSTLQEQYA